MGDIKSLYIHIPFCNHICSYCDFVKTIYTDVFSSNYIEMLKREIKSFNIIKLDTIYIGGGTPTSLNVVELETLLKFVSPLLDNNGEFTIEANVESLSEEKLQLFKKYGVNRLSIGVESFDDGLLKSMNRNHSEEDIKKTLKSTKEIGISNINIDLIYGLPNQTIEMLKVDLEKAISLNVNHISTYSLTVSKGTMFYKNKVKEISQDDSRIMYDLILSRLRKEGYVRYEVSNFAKPGFESKHNITYWRNNEYYAAGLGASRYVNQIRSTNTIKMSEYLKGNFLDKSTIEELSCLDNEKYYLMLNLRLSDGFLLSEFESLFKTPFLTKYSAQVKKLLSNSLLILENNRVKATDEGIMLLDLILRELF